MPEISEEALAELAVDDLHLSLVRELGLYGYMCVPLVARERTLGVITFAAADSQRRYGPDDLALVEELARRAASAVDNARLYREVEERAQAARVLATVGDGVFLVDRYGVVRLWNEAAEAITGLDRSKVVGNAADEVIPGWHHLAGAVPVSGAPGPAASETLPFEVLGGGERWLSISGVGFDEGTVYAFRDVTEERVLEQMRQDLVATVSHEVRTPLAAVYGSALTLTREDLELEPTLHRKLLEVIVEESSRLADIVNDLLLASQLDSGQLVAHIGSCDARQLAESVVEAARTHLPENVTVALVNGSRRAAAGRGRRGPAAAGARQPRRQRDPLLARRRRCPPHARAGGRVCPLRDLGRRSRDPAVGAEADLREVLSRRSAHAPRHRRDGPRPLHLARARPARRGPDLGRRERRPRVGLLRRDPGRPGACPRAGGPGRKQKQAPEKSVANRIRIAIEGHDHMGMTVLIVDDHPSFRASARTLLEAEGYEVIGEAENGIAAVRAAKKLHPDLVLLDVQLPDLDGFQVAERLRELDDPPQVVLTSSRDGADYGRCIECSGARGFVPKADLSGAAIAALLTA